MKIKIAIVGPELSKWPKNSEGKVKKEILSIIRSKCPVYTDGTRITNDRFCYDDIILVSGHCPKGGVDIWAEEIADNLGIKKEIYSAEVDQWSDEKVWEDSSWGNPMGIVTYRKGYKSRNIQIAKACDMLYCIVPGAVSLEYLFCKHCADFGHPTNGGCYTRKKAIGLGKVVHLIIVA